MLDHSRNKALGKWRRWTFRIWVGMTVALADGGSSRHA